MSQVVDRKFDSSRPERVDRWTCRICGSTEEGVRFQAREQLFGLGEEFEYRLCVACGCLQIAQIPDDLDGYYGSAYYSMAAPPRHGWVASAIISARNRYLSGRFDPLGALIARRYPFAALASLRDLRLRRDTRILDVGCGSGGLLLALRSAGFFNLLGIDIYLEHDLDLDDGLRVRCVDLTELVADKDHCHSFDLVMFHHSLEHMADQRSALCSAREALAPGGRCLVRIPTVSSYAWRHYGTSWCALDAPRHLMLHSRRSIGMLAESCGFYVDRIIDDSVAFQFWGSEQCQRGLNLVHPGGSSITMMPGQFSRKELRAFERRAAALNRQGDGDTIAVYLRVAG